MKTRRKFSIQTVKGWIDFIQIIIGVHNKTFDLQLLFEGKITSSHVMRSSFFGMVFV